MQLEHFGMAEPGDCRVVFSASAEELERAVQAEQSAPNAPTDEEELLTAAVNRAILEVFSPLYAELVAKQHLVPVTDPDFELPIEPRPIRRLTLELEINRHHGDEDRAADEAGKKALRERVAREIYKTRCAQAEKLAERELVYQLGGEVTGALPKQLVAGNYFAEQREFNLRLQANNVNFDQYLKVRNQTVEQFRAELHAQAEQKLRGRLGLLLVAEREGLWPTEAEVQEALSNWKGEKTFPSNDARKLRQGIASQRAAAFVRAHSTLTPPPSEPVVVEAAE